MCYVNYVRESTSFMRFACDQGLTANERLLWYALFDVMNARAKGSDWPEGLIPITNKQLLSLVPFGEDSMAAARNKLKQRGLIDFKPGKKNAAPPMYQMVYFAAELSTEKAQNVDFYPIHSGNIGDNIEGNIGGNIGGNSGCNSGGNSGGIILNYKPNGLNRNPYPNDTQENDNAAAAAQNARASVREQEIAQQFRESIGRDGMTLEIRSIRLTQEQCHVDDEVVNQAIGEAANYGARAPAQYAIELLHTWNRKGVRTIYDLVYLQYDGQVPKEE